RQKNERRMFMQMSISSKPFHPSHIQAISKPYPSRLRSRLRSFRKKWIKARIKDRAGIGLRRKDHMNGNPPRIGS
ncbi:MAG TPA: hypothetical protein VGC86_02835, partial [Afipia sp.]